MRFGFSMYVIFIRSCYVSTETEYVWMQVHLSYQGRRRNFKAGEARLYLVTYYSISTKKDGEAKVFPATYGPDCMYKFMVNI